MDSSHQETVLGHKVLRMTARYAHVGQQHRLAAVAALERAYQLPAPKKQLGDARATLVRRIPAALAPTVGYPSHDLLRSLGAVFISEQTPRVVQIGSRVYQEGGMDAVIDRVNDDMSEAIGKGRPNKTTKLQ